MYGVDINLMHIHQHPEAAPSPSEEPGFQAEDCWPRAGEDSESLKILLPVMRSQDVLAWAVNPPSDAHMLSSGISVTLWGLWRPIF